MEQALKRKNIDLPVEVLQKLSLVAVAQGKSLKSYIEGILISKAEGISVTISETVSPSDDAWFNDPQNVKDVNAGVAEAETGKTVVYTMDDIKSVLGV